MSEGVLQAFLDDELASEERAAIAAHLLECPPCRAELDALRADAALVSAALAELDVAPDLADAHRRLAPRHAVHIGPRRSAGAAARRAFVRAAVLILFGAVAASAAVPGSIVRRWIVGAWHEATRLVTGSPAPREPAPAPVASAPAPPPAAEESVAAGVSVLPYQDRVVVALDQLSPDARVRLRFVDVGRVSVEASGPATPPRFRTSPGRIEMNGDARTVRVELPRSVGYALVEVDGRPYFQKTGPDVRLLVPADTAGPEIVFEPPR